MAPSITVSSRKATERGALDGHQAKCSCGTILTTSLGEREARNLAAAHAAWHARATEQAEAMAEYGRLARVS